MSENIKEKKTKIWLIAGICIVVILFLSGIITAIISNVLRSRADEFNNKNDEIVDVL